MPYDLNVVVDKRISFTTEKARTTAYEALKAVFLKYNIPSRGARCNLLCLDIVPLKDPEDVVQQYKDKIVRKLTTELVPEWDAEDKAAADLAAKEVEDVPRTETTDATPTP